MLLVLNVCSWRAPCKGGAFQWVQAPPGIAPPRSNRSSHGGNEVAERPGGYIALRLRLVWSICGKLIERNYRSFATSGNGDSSSRRPIGSAPSLEEETDHGLFRWTGRVDGRDARVRRGPRRRGHSRGEGTVYARRHQNRAGRSTGLSAGRVRDRPYGPDAPSRPDRMRCADDLYREPAGSSGAEVVCDPQNRPQRCARPGPSRPHRLLQARAREVALGTPFAH